MKAVLGIICGLKSEAQALRVVQDTLGARIAVSGASSARARAAAAQLARDGAQVLLSVGLAGGLAADLQPGALLLPGHVVTPFGERIAADAQWLARLTEVCGAPSGRVVAGSDTAVTSPAGKRALAAAGADVVDMETHSVAIAAREAGVPWAAIRAVADDHATALPGWAMGLVREDGGIDDARAALAILKAPWTLPLALRLARANAKALAALRGAAAALRDAAPEPAAQ